MKRLANLKPLSSDSQPRKSSTWKNNPYPLSGLPPRPSNHTVNVETPRPSGISFSGSPIDSKSSFPISRHEQSVSAEKKSAAPTVNTIPDTHPFEPKSKAGTIMTAAGAPSTHNTGGEGSTFSSPAPSFRSLTTTLTTIQSAHPNIAAGTLQSNYNPAVHFSHQFPAPSNPASALPLHMVQQTANPSTYSSATANNLLTDNASILTLASSSKRRRRNSLDTNASIRALAPSSIFGGSRESLPLSVLSGPIPDYNPQAIGLTSIPSRPSIGGGFPSEQRTSVYSSSGIHISGTSTKDPTALQSERNSYYANPKANTGDGGSMRSGRFSHGRNDSVTGSVIGNSLASPLTNPLPTVSDGISNRDYQNENDWH